MVYHVIWALGAFLLFFLVLFSQGGTEEEILRRAFVWLPYAERFGDLLFIAVALVVGFILGRRQGKKKK